MFIGEPVKLAGRATRRGPDSIFLRAEVIQDGTVRASMDSEIAGHQSFLLRLGESRRPKSNFADEAKISRRFCDLTSSLSNE